MPNHILSYSFHKQEALMAAEEINKEARDVDTSSLDRGPICLCLSGGGFRATFFHLGVIIALRQLNLMPAVSNIVSVSGGSILAAHLAIHWEDYKGSATDKFLERVRKVLEFGRCDLRGRILRRMILFGWLSHGYRRRQQLIKHYSRFYDFRLLSETRGDGPEFHFLATSMTTGRLWSFCPAGIVTYDPMMPTSEERIEARGISLSLAVAASSAFPPLFPPICVTRKELQATEKEFPITQFLTDGGVFDNVGIYRARQIAHRVSSVRLIMLSDASSPFDWRTQGGHWGTLTRNVRATCILMNRVASLEEQVTVPVPTMKISIETTVQRQDLKGLDPSNTFLPQANPIQKMTRFVRTDLDEFDYPTVTALVRHGHEVTLKAVHSWAPDVSISEVEDPCPKGWPDPLAIQLHQTAGALGKARRAGERLSQLFQAPLSTSTEDTAEPKSITDRHAEAHLARASHRSVWKTFWNPADSVSWLLVGAALVLAGCTIYALIPLR
jgi:predicted acylesterase/phospholipase RssA